MRYGAPVYESLEKGGWNLPEKPEFSLRDTGRPGGSHELISTSKDHRVGPF